MKPPTILKLPRWDDEGPVGCVYPKRGPGERAAWTARWLVKPENDDPVYPGAKVVCVDDWGGAALGAMTDEEILAELEDAAVIAPMPFCREAAKLALDRGYSPHDTWRYQAEAVLTQTRQSHPEVVAGWNPPDKKAMHLAPATRRSWPNE